MSEPRSVQQLIKEFSDLALKAGNLQFEIELKKKDLEMINGELKNLNLEYIQAKNKEAEAAKESK